MNCIYQFSPIDIEGHEHSLAQYQGKYILIVNIASKCGFTPQYAELEALYQKHRDQLVILGFPCNQFANQEPGNEEEIKNFCSMNYSVTFPLFSKIEVNGPNTHPLYLFLKEQLPGIMGSKAIKWNFTKFLIGPDGQCLKRYAPIDKIEKIEIDLAIFQQ